MLSVVLRGGRVTGLGYVLRREGDVALGSGVKVEVPGGLDMC